MRWLLFLSRVALICNLCYVFMVVGRYFKLDNIPQQITSTVVVLGISGILLNLFVTLIWLINVLKGRRTIPAILGLINFLFLLFELINSALALY